MNEGNKSETAERAKNTGGAAEQGRPGGGTAAAPAGAGAAAGSAAGGIRSGETVVAAADGSLEAVQTFVDEYMERLNPSGQARMHVALAVEEIFVNIAHYAYAPGEAGAATVRCEADAGTGRLTVVFTDGGAPYDPLAKADPDVTLPLEERPIGGLGIFITKRLMDAVDYRFENGKNVLTIVKNVK
ncbi:MAG: ATP-binding protein [Peptococcaceae bacterium]|jgi:anti-sigma regulatory factor (Ser/Thr protein kinase)|nr:ATP-binding protein [Peptococcaceae bacterium]